MTKREYFRPAIKGICVVALLESIGVVDFSFEWWIAMLALNVSLSL